eukprot:7248784-Ditylum_brightwellii.AAC.1
MPWQIKVSTQSNWILESIATFSNRNNGRGAVRQNKIDAGRQGIDVVVLFDMGWQKKGSGHTYDLISGHAFMSGAWARMILAYMICCKLCGVCNVAERVGKEPEEH